MGQVRRSTGGGQWWCVVVLTVLLPPIPAAAQRDGPATPALEGRVVDARSGRPIPGATVTLAPLPVGLLAGGRGDAPGFGDERQAVTDRKGSYAFDPLTAGTFRMSVARIGYRTAVLEIRYDGPSGSRVSVGLEIEPVRLEPLDVETPGTRASANPRPEAGPDGERVRAERLRWAREAPGDSRYVTGPELGDASTLAEPDVLRALHRLPGVTGEDDWSAEPWTRGSRWDETRLFFDGLPLYHPTLFGGVFTSISPDAVGTLTFHPGVHPADAPDASVGIVDLRTRPAQGEDLSLLAHLSPLSARFSLDRPWGPASGLTVSGRRSYLEELTRADAETHPEDYLPYSFHDLTARLDQRLARGLHLEASALHAGNSVDGDLPYGVKGARARWGSSALRLGLELDRGGLRARLVDGRSGFDATVERVPWDVTRPDLDDAVTGADTRNRIESSVTELSLEPHTDGGRLPSWEVGLRRSETAIDYAGPAPWPYPSTANAGSFDHRSRTTRHVLWGSVRESILPTLTARVGARVDLDGGGHDDGGAVELDPRIHLTWSPRSDLRVTLGAGRHRQLEQAVGAAGLETGPALNAGHLWLSAGGGAPVLRSEVVSGGVEAWLGGDWLLSAHAWGRRSEGHLMPSPDSGSVRATPPLADGAPAPGWTTGTGRAAGLELGVRKVAGRWTGSLSYSLSRSRMRADGRSFRAPGDRPHALDAQLSVQATSSLRLGAVFTAVGGAPFTRFYAFRCEETSWYCPTAGETPPVLGWVEPAGGGQRPAYASLDVQVSKVGTLFGLPFGGYLQLRNLLNRENESAYLGSILDCDEYGMDCTLRDSFDDGMPLAPVLGFWIRL